MINKENIKIKFDNSFNGRLFAVQGDTGRAYYIQVYDDLDELVDVAGMSLKLYIGNSKEVSYAIGEIVDAAKGKFEVKIHNSQLKYPGKQKAQFELTNKNGEILGTKIFDIYIEEGLKSGSSLGRNLFIDFESINETLELIKNHDKTLQEAKTTDAILKTAIKEGKSTSEDLASCKKKALEIKGDLDTSKKEATKACDDLNKLKKIADSTTEDLENKILNASTIKADLDNSVNNAKTNKANLDASNKIATETNTSLKSADAKAKNTESLIKDLMSKLDLTKEEVKQIIASGNLSKYITGPKLKEALNPYAKKQESINKLDFKFKNVESKDGKLINHKIYVENNQLYYEDNEVGKSVKNDFIKLNPNADSIELYLKSDEKGVVLLYSLTDESIKYAIHTYESWNRYKIDFGKVINEELILATVTMPESAVEIMKVEVE